MVAGLGAPEPRAGGRRLSAKHAHLIRLAIFDSSRRFYIQYHTITSPTYDSGTTMCTYDSASCLRALLPARPTGDRVPNGYGMVRVRTGVQVGGRERGARRPPS